MLPSVEHDPTENKEIKKKYAKMKQNEIKKGGGGYSNWINITYQSLIQNKVELPTKLFALLAFSHSLQYFLCTFFKSE